MIKQLEIDGFKSLKNVVIEIKPITVLIGLNSSGKSSVLQFLQILKQSTKEQQAPRTSMPRTNQLRTSGNYINLGSFEDVVYGKKKTEKISFRIVGARNQELVKPFSEITLFDYFAEVDGKGVKQSKTTIMSGSFRLEGEYNRKNPKTQFAQSLVEFQSLKFQCNNFIAHPFSYVGAIPTSPQAGPVLSRVPRPMGEPSPSFLYEDEVNQLLDSIMLDLCDYFMVPAIRGMSSFSRQLDAMISDDFVDAFNLDRQETKFASSFVYLGSDLEDKINKWMAKITGISVRGRTVPDKKAAIEAHKRIDVNIVNEGFGTNQLVYLFAQIAAAPINSLIGIEEPEVHLHPKAQSELAKVLIEIFKEEQKNLIITTHSEHILYRFMIEIARGNLKKDDLAIYYFSISQEGITKAEKLEIDEKGRLSKGMPDFMEADLNEFKDFLEALKA